jgi:hypothetical protein
MKYKKLRRDKTLIDEHRYVLEDYLGRPLEAFEIVHHIDGDGLNNRIENLELCSRSAHTKYHSTIFGTLFTDNAKSSLKRWHLSAVESLSCYQECTVCKSILPFSSFNKNRTKKNGMNNICRRCRSESRSNRYNASAKYL